MRLSAAYLVAEIQKIYLIKIIALYKKKKKIVVPVAARYSRMGCTRRKKSFTSSEERYGRCARTRSGAGAKYTNSFSSRSDNFHVTYMYIASLTSHLELTALRAYFSATIGTVSRKTNSGAIRETSAPRLLLFPQVSRHRTTATLSHAT